MRTQKKYFCFIFFANNVVLFGYNARYVDIMQFSCNFLKNSRVSACGFDAKNQCLLVVGKR